MIPGSFSYYPGDYRRLALFELQRLPADPEEEDDLALLAHPPPRANRQFLLGQHPLAVLLLPSLDDPDVGAVLQKRLLFLQPLDQP